MTNEAVYYRSEDYASFGLRMLIDIIDLFIVFAVFITVSLFTDDFFSMNLLMLVWIAIWFSYFVLLKRSKMGTVGYMVAKVRIVNLKGERPSVYSLALRLMFAILGPFNSILDLLWIPSDEHRQALRDKFAKTYVIKRTALPAGTGKIIYHNYDIFGWRFIFSEVRQQEDQSGI